MVNVLFRSFKGFAYGAVLGMFFGMGIYLLGNAVSGLGFLTVDPRVLGGVMFATGILGGLGAEYSEWLEGKASEKEQAVVNEKLIRILEKMEELLERANPPRPQA